ncbi:MAG: hypothetical protein IT454_23365 [Planctomycetes bacterium]|nr:hypothetical protein [Planctomycetota bacterium]
MTYAEGGKTLPLSRLGERAPRRQERIPAVSNLRAVDARRLRDYAPVVLALAFRLAANDATLDGVEQGT